MTLAVGHLVVLVSQHMLEDQVTLTKQCECFHNSVPFQTESEIWVNAWVFSDNVEHFDKTLIVIIEQVQLKVEIRLVLVQFDHGVKEP